MYRYLRLFAVILVALGGLLHAAPGAGGDQPGVVMIFGDSITAGSKLPKAQLDRLWVNQLQTAAGDKLKIVNEGRPGRETNSVGEFRAALKRNPQVSLLVLALGMNDSRDITDRCVPAAVKHLREMIQAARAACGPQLSVLILGPTNINKEALGPTKSIGDQREQKLQELGTAFEGLAKELGCDYISLLGVVPASSLLVDGVHPDPAGNDPIFRAMSAKVLPANSP